MSEIAVTQKNLTASRGSVLVSKVKTQPKCEPKQTTTESGGHHTGGNLELKAPVIEGERWSWAALVGLIIFFFVSGIHPNFRRTGWAHEYYASRLGLKLRFLFVVKAVLTVPFRGVRTLITFFGDHYRGPGRKSERLVARCALAPLFAISQYLCKMVFFINNRLIACLEIRSDALCVEKPVEDMGKNQLIV